jgi:hypothetical protein
MFFRGPLLPAEGKKRRLSGGQHFVGGQPVTVTGKRLSGKGRRGFDRDFQQAFRFRKASPALPPEMGN